MDDSVVQIEQINGILDEIHGKSPLGRPFCQFRFRLFAFLGYSPRNNPIADIRGKTLQQSQLLCGKAVLFNGIDVQSAGVEQ